MAKTRSTKRALLLSALSLLMCVSMLIGSTFAWFTDEVTSSGNQIVSGKLDVDLIDANGVSLENETLQFVDKDGKEILTQILWEPGCTYTLEPVRVKNNGNLWLKYEIVISGIEGDAKLLEAIEWTIMLGDNEVTLNDLKGYLEPEKTSEALQIIGHMKEEAGNEYQEKSIDGISITVYATQYTKESDSFGDQYDAGLENAQNGVSRELPDGSTVFYYNEESGFGGRVRLTALPENLGNEYVVPAEVNDLGDALKGADLDKLTIPAGVENAYKSLEGASIDEVIIADGAATVPNRMFYKANVKNIVIPETVTYIDENAFAMAGSETLTIPASVARVGEAAFQHMDNLKTVTIKGNIAIEGYAFRGCDVLRIVYLEGEDVSFIPSTLNGRNSTWFCNGESNNPNTSDITFYVENATVAERVKKAMGAEANNTPVYINEKIYVTVKNLTEFQAALDNAVNNTIISLTADITGDATFTQKNNVTLVLDGNGKKMDGTIKIVARADTTNAATLTIKNFNFVTTEANRECFIYSVETNRYPNNLTISNCTFEGTGADSNTTAVSIKSANNFVMENCKANNVHSLLQNANGGWGYTIKHCEVTNAGRGLSFNSAQNILVEDVKIAASNDKYGIRISAEYDTTATIKDCEISAFCPVVVRRASANYSLVFKGQNTMAAANTDGIWCAIGTSEYEANGVMPTDATGKVTVVINDANLDANGIYGEA